MKRLLVYITLMGIPFNLYSQNWQWLFPYPTSNQIVDFSFVDKDNGFLIAQNGEILKTADCGVTWQTRTVENMELIDIFCLNKNDVWILGQMSDSYSTYSVVITHDAGESWKVYSSLSSGSELRCIYAASEKNAWVAGSYGLIKATVDGGKTWTDQSLQMGNSNIRVNSIRFSDQQNGVILGNYDYGAVFGKTGDGGLTWSVTPLAVMNSLNSGCFAGKAGTFCVGENGLILNSKDDGLSWSFPSGIIMKDLYDIAFSDSLHGWAVGEDSTILKTSDGGSVWTKQPLNIRTDCAAVQLIDENTGWILGMNKSYYSYDKRPALLFTDNSGTTWNNKLVSFNEEKNITEVSFIDSTTGWIISNNAIYRSNDGGKTWKMQTSSGSDYYEDQFMRICLIDSLTGYCVGLGNEDHGRMLKTTNGGRIWTARSYGFDRIRDAYFFSEQIGWIVGDNGLIARTSNGGDSFEVMNSGIFAEDFVRIYFVDPNTGWVITNSNILLRTVDGGQSWLISFYKENTYYGGQALYFCDNLKGFIGTSNGLFLTTDGGKTFSPVSYSGYKDITDIHFVNALEGWMTAGVSDYSNSAGAVYHTLDGGMTWQLMINSGTKFLALSCVPDGYAWFVGEKSTIARCSYNSTGTVIEREAANDVVKDYQLYQCYPNPFNPVTTIEYDLPIDAPIILKIYDDLGRELKTLVDEHQPGGHHQIRVDLSNQASGTYFYQMIANGYVKTKKLLLIK